MDLKLSYNQLLTKIARSLNTQGDLEFMPFKKVSGEVFEEFMYTDSAAWLRHGKAPIKESSHGEVVREYDGESIRNFFHDYGRSKNFVQFLVKRPGEDNFIGTATVFLSSPQQAGIGYFVLPGQRRKGVATEIVRSLTGALEELAAPLGIKRTVAEVEVGNEASQRTMKAAGGYADQGVKPSAYADTKDNQVHFVHGITPRRATGERIH